MRAVRPASLLAFLLVPTLAAGCLPIGRAGGLAIGDDDASGAGGGSGFGGGNNATIKTDTDSSAGGAGASGAFAAASLGYLCGGSAAACVPGPTSDECAPGGSPNMIANTNDAGSKLTCQLVSKDDVVEAKCTMAGSGRENDPCNQATDCGVGLGCADNEVTDICRQYCCGDPELCGEGRYCAKAKVAEGAGEVPFCVLTKPCELLNDAAHCDPDETCRIVRANGTTSCVPLPPADQAGVEGDACPCGAGYECSNATGTCLKLCKVGGDDCDGGTCQGGNSPYPLDIGFCVPR